MPIQTTGGTPQFGPGDLVIEHRGTAVGVKLFVLRGEFPTVFAYTRSATGQWVNRDIVDGEILHADTDRETGAPITAAQLIDKWGGPEAVVRDHVLPRLNAYLARVWPAQAGGPSPAPAPSGDPLPQIADILGGLRVVKSPDGTVRVELP